MGGTDILVQIVNMIVIRGESAMCRSIKRLRKPEGVPSELELHEAALQFIRKVSGYRVPAKANEEAFNRAVAEIAATTERLMKELPAARIPKTTADPLCAPAPVTRRNQRPVRRAAISPASTS